MPTQTVAGLPVVPMQYLDQVRFTPPANFSGAEIAIKVQAVTKDYDEDAPFTPVTAVTGVAWLTSIFVLPKADSVTIGVNPREVMDEDTTRALTIRMKSTDPTEVFDADIKGIIAGAKIEFAGHVYDTADSGTWVNVNGADSLVFDSGTGKYTLQLHNLPTGTINPIYTPPLHSNDKNVLLNVDVVSKAEYNGFVTISPVQTLPIAISVLGVPDAPTLTIVDGQVKVVDDRFTIKAFANSRQLHQRRTRTRLYIQFLTLSHVDATANFRPLRGL